MAESWAAMSRDFIGHLQVCGVCGGHLFCRESFSALFAHIMWVAQSFIGVGSRALSCSAPYSHPQGEVLIACGLVGCFGVGGVECRLRIEDLREVRLNIFSRLIYRRWCRCCGVVV